MTPTRWEYWIEYKVTGDEPDTLKTERVNNSMVNLAKAIGLIGENAFVVVAREGFVDDEPSHGVEHRVIFDNTFFDQWFEDDLEAFKGGSNG